MNISVVRAPSRAFAVLIALALAVSMLALAPAAFAQEPDVQRLAGDDRFGTAAEVALETYPDGAANVIIAAGFRFPDSLASGGLAGLADAPILLVNDVLDEATSETLDALAALDPDTLWIAGGTAAVSAAIEAQLAAAGDWDIERFAGDDRFDTAALMAELFDPADVDTVAVATGRVAADSLAVGPLAFHAEIPILLTEVNELPARTEELLADLDPDTVLILGGSAAVSTTVEDEIAAAAGADTERLAGATRFETAIEIAEYANANFGDHFDYSEVSVATGFGPTRHALGGVPTPADALSGAPYGGVVGSPLLPINDVLDTVPDSICTFLEENSGMVELITIFGGTAAVSQNVEDTLLECATPDVVPIPDNVTVTAAPELVRVETDGDIVSFFFDKNVPGKSLNFIDAAGVPSTDPTVADISFYTGPRLYTADGTAHFPFEAGIFGNEVRTRFESATVVGAAVRAGVYENTVQDATGLSNPASDFPLRATAIPPDPIDPYFPQLTDVSNLRTTDVTPIEILVDYTLTFATEADATAAQTAINTTIADPLLSEAVADDFALVGSAGQIFRGIDLDSTSRTGANVTVTVVMDPAVEDIPVTQLRRGFIEEDALLAEIGDHILLSTAWGNITDVNGTTTDPDLRAVERGPGANQMRFIFDEAVNVPVDALLQEQFYTVVNNAEDRAVATSVGRSLIEADEATVMIATFDTPDAVAYPTASDYLDTVTAATVDVQWADAERTVVDFGAAQATNQVGSVQLGWNTPAQVLVTPVQPEVPEDPTPGVTELPDLVSVEKSQNAITGNWQVTFTFDEDVPAGTFVDFSLYDENGVRFSAASRAVEVLAADDTFTFGPDVADTTFSNEQIEASLLGTVQDADADLETDFATAPQPVITEGHDVID